jgi:hypothetical protein
MTGIHDVFPANDEDDGDDPISEKKLKKFEGQYSTIKTLLGFDFDGVNKTMWLETAKREKLLTILRGWIRTGHRGPLAYRSRSSNPQSQKYVMHSHASRWETVSSPRATGY